MKAVRTHDTAPERLLQTLLRSAGYKFHCHPADLPARPDVVFPSRRKVIFVHGCFWHRHEGCRRATMPARNVHLWQSKFDANVRRDRATARALRRTGWGVMVVWECELAPANRQRLLGRLRRFLTRSGTSPRANTKPAARRAAGSVRHGK